MLSMVLVIMTCPLLFAAVVEGTSAGFVITTPSSDPEGSGVTFDGDARAVKSVAPAGATSIVEVGWWCGDDTEESNFEIGLYDHDSGDDEPNNRLFVDTSNAKGTTTGWKSVAVDWAISAGTTYWIAVQLDATDTGTPTDYAVGIGRGSKETGSATLADPWAAVNSETENLIAIYAKYQSGTNVGYYVRRH